MGQAIFSVRMEENIKIAFESWCNYFGMNMSTAINIFARTVVQEQKIPFEISASELFSPTNANKMLNEARRQALKNGVADLSMEEIDEEISKTRKGIGEWNSIMQ